MAGVDWERVGLEVTVVMGWVVSATGEVWVVAGAVGEGWVVVVAREMGWEATVAEEGVVVVVMVEGWRGRVRQ